MPDVATSDPSSSSSPPGPASEVAASPPQLPAFETWPAEACERSIDDGTLLAGILGAMRSRYPEVEASGLERAFDLARRAHHEQRRKSGEPFFMHPIRVATHLAQLGLDQESVIAGLLHDAVEDADLSVVEITEAFGREVAGIVDGVTKLGKVPFLSRQEQQAESFRKMLLAMSSDIRVLLVKLVDRLDNMRTLAHMPSDKQERISRETMEIYAPLAHRLGLEWLRRELQDLAFSYLQPAAYAALRAKIEAVRGAEPGAVEQGRERLLAALGLSSETEATLGPWPMIEGRSIRVRPTFRSLYRVYTKYEQVAREIAHTSDLITYQIITPDRPTCYLVLGLVHERFTPVPGSFRDYIALPRANEYQALHTAVLDKAGTRYELHILSERMDDVAERGIIAASPASSALGWTQEAADPRRLKWLAGLMDWQEGVADPNEFIAAVKSDLFADEVYVFTPEGDIYTFPKGATPIDFAFAIHSDVGMQCSGARVNGQAVALRYRLRQGDTVEIVTAPGRGPTRDWLKMCETSRARTKIRHHLRQLERDQSRKLGRRLLEQSLAPDREGVTLERLEAEGAVQRAVESLGLAREAQRPHEGGVEALYEAVGDGRAPIESVLRLLEEGTVKREPSSERSETNLLARVLRRMTRRAAAPVAPSGAVGEDAIPRDGAAPLEIDEHSLVGRGAGGVVTLGSCCLPVPGDPLVGFFERGRGIIAHREGCPSALEAVSGQRVRLLWAEGLELEFSVTIEVRTGNTVGLLAKMSRAFSKGGVNIKEANCRTFDDGRRAINTFSAVVRDRGQLERVMADLREVEGVSEVERVFREQAPSASESTSGGESPA